MKKRHAVMTGVAVCLVASTAIAAEFQPIGTLGMGGAGVARSMGPYASYWNPAGLAFSDKSFAMTTGAGVGLRVSEGLADNVDNISKFTEGSPSTIDRLKDLNTTAADPKAVADIVSLLAVIKDIEVQKGTLSLNVDAAAGFQMKRVGFGLFATSEGFARPLPDLVNVLPSNNSSTQSVTQSEILTLVSNQSTSPPNSFFSTDQITAIRSALSSAGITSETDQYRIMNAIVEELSSGSATLPNLSSQQVTTALTDVFAPAISTTATDKTIDNNQTAAMIKNAFFFEAPISYGHPFDLGPNGKLGLGATVKAIRGRVYQTSVKLIKNGNVSSDDIVDNFKENYEESTAVTFDLGAQYKYGDWLTLGVVGKNLTSPKFRSPVLKDQNGVRLASDGKTPLLPTDPDYRDPDIKLKPQVRAGVMVEPTSWITLAADIDLTENETVLPALDYKSRTLGGGVEFHLSWAKLRAGMYKNLANDDIGPVATAGFSLGIPWVLLEVDGAYGLKEARYKEKDYPREARANAQLTIQF